MASMRLASSEVVDALMFLLPGLVWTGVYSSLVSRPISDGFQIVIRAFIFTAVFQIFVMPFLELSGLSEQNSPSSWIWERLVLVLVAVVIGVVSAHIWNKDYIHRLLRYCNVTVESSYPSALYPAFAFHRNCYVVMHLKDRRRLYGWPREWPSRPDDRHFLIKDCEWLVEDGRNPIEGVSHILISESEVKMVEFLPCKFGHGPGEKTTILERIMRKIKLGRNPAVQRGVSPKPPNAVKPPPPPPPPPKK